MYFVQFFLLFFFYSIVDRYVMTLCESMKPVEQLARYVCDQGASAAAWIRADQLRVEERFAEMCAHPGCPSYGLSPGCPPYVMKPDAFQAVVDMYQAVVVFRINSMADLLRTQRRKHIARDIHRLAATAEQQALQVGFVKALGFGAGSCKELFCEQDARCQVLDGGACVYPDLARSSVAGVGVDVQALCEGVGWQLSWQEPNKQGEQSEPVQMACMLGLVLVG